MPSHCYNETMLNEMMLFEDQLYRKGAAHITAQVGLDLLG